MMQLAVDIDEADIGLVHEGQQASFAVDAYPQRRFPATLVSLRNLPKSANGVVTYEGLLTVDNSSKLLRPGLTATANILVSEAKDALLVPNGALRFTPPAKDASPSPLEPATNGELKGRIWVLDGKTPVLRDLRIGRSDGRNTEVLSGDLKSRRAGHHRHRQSNEWRMSAELIRLMNVRKVYGAGEAAVVALDGIDLTIRSGEFVAVLGPSGSGKSTAMNILGCLDTPTSGHYLFRGVDVGSLSRDQRALLRRNSSASCFRASICSSEPRPSRIWSFR